MQTQAELIQSYIVYSLGLDIYHSFYIQYSFYYCKPGSKNRKYTNQLW